MKTCHFIFDVDAIPLEGAVDESNVQSGLKFKIRQREDWAAQVVRIGYTDAIFAQCLYLRIMCYAEPF